MKKIICLILCALLTLINSVCFASDGEKHEDDLEDVLLGRRLTENQKDPDKNAKGPEDPAVLFGYLEDAIYLCVDQMGNQGQKWLDELNEKFKVEGLPKSIDDISVPEEHHEKYTHLGWDYKFYDYPEKWTIRQNILLATVSKVFDLHVDNGLVGNEKYSQQCTNIAKIIYYVHILGDHAENKLSTTTDRIQLRNATKTRGEVEFGLINELRHSISELFQSQKTSMKYNRLMVNLNVIRFRAWIRGEESSNDGIKRNSDEYIRNEKKHEKIQDIAGDAIKCLQPNLRKLLLELPFYKRVFGNIVNDGL